MKKEKIAKSGIARIIGKLILFSVLGCLVLAVLFGGIVAIGGTQAKMQRAFADEKVSDTEPADNDVVSENVTDEPSPSDYQLSDDNVSKFDGETILRIIRFEGNAITVCDEKQPYTFSFAGVIMTPAAMRYVESLLSSKRVVVRPSSEDDMAGYFYALNGKMVQEELIYRGLVTVDEGFSEHLSDFLSLQEGAQVMGVGIWANK